MKNNLPDDFKQNEKHVNKPKDDRFVMFKVGAAVIFLLAIVGFRFFSNNPRYQRRSGPLNYIIDQSAGRPIIGAVVLGALFAFVTLRMVSGWKKGRIHSRTFWGYVTRKNDPVKFQLSIIGHAIGAITAGSFFFYFLWKCLQPFMS